MERETTKIRPVFDASARNQDGISLNSEILTTPVALPPLTGVLNRFRSNKIALTADISKMFLRIHVPEDQIKYQRFLCRFDSSEPIRHAAITKTCFGRADSPFNASKAVILHCEAMKDRYPRATSELTRNLYVDDLLTGCDSVETAVQLQKDSVEMLSLASFPLRKWCSNSIDVIRRIPDELRGEKSRVLLTNSLDDAAELDGEKVAASSALGVEWNVEEDTLNFTGFTKITLQVDGATKRSVTSNTCKFFDPLGLISPFIITAKILIQSTWKRKIGWDDPIPEDMLRIWRKWVTEVPMLERIVLPRCVRLHAPNNGQEKAQLIVFSDASDMAFGAAVYIRYSYPHNKSETHLLMSKSRVAPLKDLTLPRKELVAALTGARLLKHVAEEMNLNPKEAACFSDSMTTLMWLRKPPRTWKQYVANRVQQLHDITDASQWTHVAGPDNPADLPSRGVSAGDLVGNKFWFNGPSWLERPEEEWPRETIESPSTDYLEEQRGPGLEDDDHVVLFSFPENDVHERLWGLPWRRLLGVTARIQLLARRSPAEPGPTDLIRARHYWIRRDQQRFLADTIQRLEQEIPLRKGDSLCKFGVKMTADGLLVAQGRLQESLLSDEEKNPIILPRLNCRSLSDIQASATARFVYDVHAFNQHAGADWILQHLRQRYWIISGRRSIRSVINHCVRCQLATKKSEGQKMAPLPLARLHTTIPWAYVGVDHAGPFRIRDGGEDSHVYVVIFTDMVSRGVHFEVVCDRTTNAFFDAFRLFISRRGIPFDLYSDEAKEFVRAKRELITLYQLVPEDELRAQLANWGVDWHLNVPYSPHRGGAWERMLRTFKETLRKCIGTRVLTERSLRLYAAEIEAMMNDRPLCVPPASTDISEAITPSLIMNGRRLRNLPSPEKPAAPIFSGDDAGEIYEAWRNRQKLLRHAWKQFTQTYMKQVLLRFPKWERGTLPR
jgi:hypothetical protein